MSEPWTIFASSADLLNEIVAFAADVGLPIEAEVVDSPERAAAQRASLARVAIARTGRADDEALVRVGRRTETERDPLPIASVGAPEVALHRMRELGFAAVNESATLVATMALLGAGGRDAALASIRGLSSIDRARFDGSGTNEKVGGRLRRSDRGMLAHEGAHGETALGRAADVAAAVRAVREAHRGVRTSMPRVEGVDTQAVLDVILGPSRALSDPASKAALDPYDLPVPLEELCQSPSRAATEAARIGFPVRIALASPELRPSEHPDLIADGVDSASRARDVYRQLLALAEARRPGARVLGVTVSATTTARALLRVESRSLDADLVEARIGFADPHGRAAGDETVVIVPAAQDAIERALSRLVGRTLLFEGTPGEKREVVTTVGDLVLRVAAFVHDFRREVESVTIDPLAVLVGGSVEVREACVRVSDAFARSMSEPDGKSTP